MHDYFIPSKKNYDCFIPSKKSMGMKLVLSPLKSLDGDETNIYYVIKKYIAQSPDLLTKEVHIQEVCKCYQQ